MPCTGVNLPATAGRFCVSDINQIETWCKRACTQHGLETHELWCSMHTTNFPFAFESRVNTTAQQNASRYLEGVTSQTTEGRQSLQVKTWRCRRPPARGPGAGPSLVLTECPHCVCGGREESRPAASATVDGWCKLVQSRFGSHRTWPSYVSNTHARAVGEEPTGTRYGGASESGGAVAGGHPLNAGPAIHIPWWLVRRLRFAAARR
jgi:hypothetical protein